VCGLCRYLRCPENCSGNGICLMNGTCICDEGWMGDGCSLPTCPNNCSYPKGTCQSQQACICDNNYHGKLIFSTVLVVYSRVIRHHLNFCQFQIPTFEIPNHFYGSSKYWIKTRRQYNLYFKIRLSWCLAMGVA